ncbi:hypothetical protein Tco_0902904 [Tanacetum coccineum]
MASVLRAYLHAYDLLFSMAIRYLISIHKGFYFCQGIFSPITNLTERLLLEECDLPATPQEGLFQAPPFDEVDIQALAHAVELTRQGAAGNLNFAKGDLFQAFQFIYHALSFIFLASVNALLDDRITMVLLPFSFLEPLCPGIMDMINNQDIEHMIPPTPPRCNTPKSG